MKQKVAGLFLMILMILIMGACSKNNEKENKSDITTGQTESIECGNSMRNLQNGGLMATDGENILYNNSKALFVKNIISEEYMSIAPDKAEQINVVDGWVYYYSEDSGVWKVTVDGKELTLLREGDISNLIVMNDGIYFSQEVNTNSNKPTLVKMDVDDNQKQLEHIYEGYTENLNFENGWFYFYTPLEEAICSIRTNGEEFRRICSLENQPRCMIVSEEVIYYLTQDEKLYSIGIDGGENKLLLDLRDLGVEFDYADGFNIDNGYIFLFSTYSLYPQLCKLSISDSKYEIITCTIDAVAYDGPEGGAYYPNITQSQFIDNELYFLQEDNEFDNVGIFKFDNDTKNFNIFG